MDTSVAHRRTARRTAGSAADAVARTMDAPDPLDGFDGWAGEDDPPSSPIELGSPHVERGRQARAALAKLSPSAAPDEELLLDLACDEVALVDALHLAAARLAATTIEVMNDSKSVLSVTRALREVVTTKSALSRRVEALLSTASTLRAQRAFLERARMSK